MAIVLPSGVSIDIVLSPHSHLHKDGEARELIIAALSTQKFPQARQQFFNMVNRNLSNWHGIYALDHQAKPNREQRRKMKKGK